jgi:hypothetical protein
MSMVPHKHLLEPYENRLPVTNLIASATYEL